MTTRREFLRTTTWLAAGAATVGAPGVARAQQKMVLKASDVHPLGNPTVRRSSPRCPSGSRAS